MTTVKIVKQSNRPGLWFNDMVGETVQVIESFKKPYPGFKCQINDSKVGNIPKACVEIVKSEKTKKPNKYYTKKENPKPRGPAPKVPDKKLMAMEKEGKTHMEIARHFKVNPQTIRNRFKLLGLEKQDCRTIARSNRVVKPFSVKPGTIRQINEIALVTGMLLGEVIETAVQQYYTENQINEKNELAGI